MVISKLTQASPTAALLGLLFYQNDGELRRQFHFIEEPGDVGCGIIHEKSGQIVFRRVLTGPAESSSSILRAPPCLDE